MSDQAAGGSAPSSEQQPPKPRRGPGRPFVKGQSGNPSGRAKGVRLIAKELLAPYAEDFAEALLDIARNAKQDAARVDAVKLAFAYFSGPPPAEPQKQTEDVPAQPSASLDEARRVVAAAMPAPAQPVPVPA